MSLVREVLAVRGLREHTTDAFRRVMVASADSVPMDPSHLAAVMSFETAGTFRPDIKNPRSGFVGLIQFGPAAAKALGTTTAALARMSSIGQLRYVVRYYALVADGRSVLTLEDAYLAVFAGRIGVAPSSTLYQAPSKAYEQNRELDSDGDGRITAAEATRFVRAIYESAKKEAPIAVDMSPLDLGSTPPESC